MAAEQVHFIYTGGGREVIPRQATHVSIHDSITVIPAELFQYHPNIVELICHEGVERIEHYAFRKCRRLKRVIIRCVKTLGVGVFSCCKALTYVECPKLETIGVGAFVSCESLSSINLQSVKVVEGSVFADSALKDVEFGSNLDSMGRFAFHNCSLLERITFPLREDIIASYAVFRFCDKLSRVNLVEIEVLNETIAVLSMDNWKRDMNVELDSINQSLPNVPAMEKTRVIQEWMGRVLHKIVGYKAQHRRVLNEATALLQLSLPNDIVTNNVMSFMELPSHTFEGEIGVEETTGMPE